MEQQREVIVFVPALVAVLGFQESQLGRDLTKEEVESIRDKAGCIVVPLEAAIDLEEGRGYEDISPEHVRKDWLEYKASTK